MSNEIKVKRISDGQVFTNDMSSSFTIIELHFCTSYTQAVVQWQDGDKYIEQDLIIPPLGSKPNPLDLIATQDDEEGVFV